MSKKEFLEDTVPGAKFDRGITDGMQRACLSRLRSEGLTVVGWARKNDLNISTVRAVLYGQFGRQEDLSQAPTARKILGKLQTDGFLQVRRVS